MSANDLLPVTSIPTQPPGHSSLQGATFTAEISALVEVWGKASAGSGSGYLLRWDPTAAKWRPWGADAKSGQVPIDSATPALLEGTFEGRWGVGRCSSGIFCFLVDPAITLTELHYNIFDGIQ